MRSNFENCSFQEGLYKYIVFDGSTFVNCNFEQSDFKSCHFNKSKFEDNCRFFDIDFYGSSFVGASFDKCSINSVRLYGSNIWNVKTVETSQKDLIASNLRNKNEELKKRLVVNDIELAHLINLLAANKKFNSLFSNAKSHFVLVLGRFIDLPGKNLRAIQDKLNQYPNYIPIVFDWDNKDSSLDLIEVIVLLSGLSRFIIVDLSEPKSVPAELQAILSTIMIPVIPILQDGNEPFGVYSFTNKYNWVNGIIKFDSISQIIENFDEVIINTAERMAKEILAVKKDIAKSMHVKDLIKKDRLK